MPSAVADKFYHSKRWQKCRAAYIAGRVAIDGGLCEVCREVPGYIVHHKVWIDETNIDNPAVTLNHSNLRYECLACHNMEQPDGIRRWPERENRYTFDENGDLIPDVAGKGQRDASSRYTPLKSCEFVRGAHRGPT